MGHGPQEEAREHLRTIFDYNTRTVRHSEKYAMQTKQNMHRLLTRENAPWINVDGES
jgi:hypothetical protein